MNIVTMKLLVLSILLVAVDCQMSIIGPMLSSYPCDDQTIKVMFEPALRPKDNNQYYVYANRVFPKYCKIRFNFDSEVNITLILQTENNKYMRMVLPEGDTFHLNISKQHSSLGFIVKGTEPGVTPYLLSFLVDDVELCNNPVLGFLEQYAEDTEITEDETCGRRAVDHSELITLNAGVRPGDWPWHAAVYRLEDSANKYICGGTLLSKKAVVTAAHCTTYRGTKYPSEALTVVLGKYSLTENDKESEEKGVQKIVVHENFNYRHLVKDIALLILKTEVNFNDYIRPACLWYKGLEKTLKSDTIYGTVVGWGFGTTDRLSTTLQQVTMPIVSEVTCLRSNPLFYGRALNDFTFCAGYHNRTTVSRGDSGGGFQVFIPHEVQTGTKSLGTWHVRGILSTAYAAQDAPSNQDQYAVFTDVEKYTDWIKNHWED